jgi:hypothetical protein
MTLKSFFAICVLIVSVATIASAKSYYFTLTGPTLAGTNELKAGAYEVKLEGSQAILTDQTRGKSVTIPVTIEHAEKKFNDTEVESTNKDGKDSIRAIMLGGSDTRIVLGQ